MLSATYKASYAECRYAERRYAECHGDSLKNFRTLKHASLFRPTAKKLHKIVAMPIRRLPFSSKTFTMSTNFSLSTTTTIPSKSMKSDSTKKSRR